MISVLVFIETLATADARDHFREFNTNGEYFRAAERKLPGLFLF